MKKVDRIYPLRQMPVNCCPKNCPVIISGGIGMLKSDGLWYSGMAEIPFSRELNWTPEWWACIINDNDELPDMDVL